MVEEDLKTGSHPCFPQEGKNRTITSKERLPIERTVRIGKDRKGGMVGGKEKEEGGNVPVGKR